MNSSKIKNLTSDLLKNSYNMMQTKIEKAINSGAIDIDQWSEDNNPMIIPKIIIIAILEDEADQYKAQGTCFEKEVKREVKNLKLFI